MNKYDFELVLTGVNQDTPNLVDALFVAGCDDAIICTYNGFIYVDFAREAECCRDAVMSAIKDIESAKIGALVASVDAGDLVGITDIATLSGISKKTISAYKDGKRGKGGFPSPIQRITKKSPIWRWAEVANWLFLHGKIDKELADNALITEAFNQALIQRKSSHIVSEILRAL